MRAAFVEYLADLDRDEAELVVRAMSDAQVEQGNLFPHWATEGQAPPPGEWRTWAIVGARGFGKTRAGAEWVLARAREGSDKTRIALVAASVEEARLVMVEGPSGILASARGEEVKDWSASKREILFGSGARATLYSGASAGMLRGPEHDFAWCDEIAKWGQAREAWDNLQLGLRRGANPCAVVTTTPRAGSIVADIAAEPDCVRTGGGSGMNVFLPPSYLRAIERRYAGTRRGAEELDGSILADVEGSLWPAALIDASRRREDAEALAASARRVVVGVDPPASAAGTCGIVVAAAVGGRRIGRCWRTRAWPAPRPRAGRRRWRGRPSAGARIAWWRSSTRAATWCGPCCGRRGRGCRSSWSTPRAGGGAGRAGGGAVRERLRDVRGVISAAGGGAGRVAGRGRLCGAGRGFPSKQYFDVVPHVARPRGRDGVGADGAGVGDGSAAGGAGGVRRASPLARLAPPRYVRGLARGRAATSGSHRALRDTPVPSSNRDHAARRRRRRAVKEEQWRRLNSSGPSRT